MLNLSLLLALIALIAKAIAYTELEAKEFMFKTIDPIVLHGLYTSHLHTFFGSDGVTANTNTSAELRAGCTTAANPNDLSTYWIPSLLVTPPSGAEQHIAPFRFSAYYENLENAVIPFPENLKLVAGIRTATNTAELDPNAQITWYCEGDQKAAGLQAGDFPTNTCSTYLQTLLFFPDCVDPTNLTDYGYSSTAFNNVTPDRCKPGTKRIPRLRFSILYDLRSVLPNGWNGTPPLRLSSGNSYSTHGDFFNGWDPTAAANMAANKLNPPGNAPTVFGEVDGTKLASLGQPPCVAKDRDPNN